MDLPDPERGGPESSVFVETAFPGVTLPVMANTPVPDELMKCLDASVIAGVLTPDGERFGVVSNDDVLRNFGIRSWVLTSEDELRDQLKEAGMPQATLDAKLQHAREWMSTLIFGKRAS